MKTKTLSLLMFLFFFAGGIGLAIFVPKAVQAGPPTGPPCNPGCTIGVCHNNVNECDEPLEPLYHHIGHWTGTDCIGPYDCGVTQQVDCVCQGGQYIP